MVLLNQTGEEINAKIVYYGPGLSGKTTNLETIHRKMPSKATGKMVSMKTRTDRTLFFDFLPIELGEIGGYPTRFLMYTVPGQVYYNATRKLVLKGADAVVFVADSSREKLDENLESLRNLEDNLNEHGLSLDTIPWVIQYNKRDLPDAMPVEELHEQLNLLGVPAYEAVAAHGPGVYETFEGIAGLLYKNLKERLERGEKVDRMPDGSDPIVQAVATSAAGKSAAKPEPQDENFEDAIDSALREVPGEGAESLRSPDETGATPARAPEPRASSVPETEPEPEPETGNDAPGADRVYDISNGDYASAVADADADADAADESNADPSDTTEADRMFREMDEMDSEVGRTLEFEDGAGDGAGKSGDDASNDFITDPMGAHTKPKQEPAAEKDAPALPPRGESAEPNLDSPAPRQAAAPKPQPKAAPAPEPARPEPVAAPPKPEVPAPRPQAPAPRAAAPEVEIVHPARPAGNPPTEPIEVSVPVTLTRAQIRRNVPLRLNLEISIVDD